MGGECVVCGRECCRVNGTRGPQPSTCSRECKLAKARAKKPPRPQRQCKRCGSSVVPPERGPVGWFCSDHCRHKHRWEKVAKELRPAQVCQRCGGQFTGHKRTYCSPACRVAKDIHCRNCGKLFIGRQNQRSCSAECNLALRVKAHTKSNHTDCQWCGRRFKPRQSQYSTFCSRECSKGMSIGSATVRELVLRFKKRVASRVANRKMAVAQCRNCSNPSHMLSGESVCDPCKRISRRAIARIHYVRSCGGTVGKHRHRARAHGVSYTPIRRLEVFNRDKWRCQLCGKRCDKTWTPGNPNAPELDHIIPLSKGGDHAWHNVQCACSECNGRKGDRPMGQRRLAFD